MTIPAAYLSILSWKDGDLLEVKLERDGLFVSRVASPGPRKEIAKDSLGRKRYQTGEGET
jgi:antitoxin component of MazEF toxin-antitoxin module